MKANYSRTSFVESLDTLRTSLQAAQDEVERLKDSNRVLWESVNNLLSTQALMVTGDLQLLCTQLAAIEQATWNRAIEISRNAVVLSSEDAQLTANTIVLALEAARAGRQEG